MADVSKIFKPRRGKKSTMTGTKASTILAAGELFVEVPDTGVGTGAGKLKMGDGTTAYSSLPYLMGDTSNDKIEFSSNSASTVANALNSVTSGATLKTIVAALKQAINLNATAITQLNDDLGGYAASNHTHDDRYYTESEINTKITTLQNSFQDGCDTIVAGCTTYGGVTPSSNSPDDIVLAIQEIANSSNLSTDAVSIGYFNGKSSDNHSSSTETYTIPVALEANKKYRVIFHASNIVSGENDTYPGTNWNINWGNIVLSSSLSSATLISQTANFISGTFTSYDEDDDEYTETGLAGGKIGYCIYDITTGNTACTVTKYLTRSGHYDNCTSLFAVVIELS